MNVKTFCLQGLLGGLLVTMAVGSLALPAMAAGTLLMAEKLENGQPGGDQCSVPVPAAGSASKLVKLGDTSCKNDQVRYFRFVDVPSPTTVSFADSPYCTYVGAWFMQVKSIKHPTTSQWKALQDIRNTALNSLVTVGVEKIYDNNFSGQIPGKLSCVTIIPPER